ncbi:hypothetical protein ABQE69_09190 [Mycolicibacillus trivialis]
MKFLKRIWSPSDTEALVEHARKWAGLHTIQAYTSPQPGDDELEFERDMAYLRDLANAVMVEARAVAPFMDTQELLDRRTSLLCNEQESDYRFAGRPQFEVGVVA